MRSGWGYRAGVEVEGWSNSGREHGMFSWTTPEDVSMADLVGGNDKRRCWGEVLKPFLEI